MTTSTDDGGEAEPDPISAEPDPAPRVSAPDDDGLTPIGTDFEYRSRDGDTDDIER